MQQTVRCEAATEQVGDSEVGPVARMPQQRARAAQPRFLVLPALDLTDIDMQIPVIVAHSVSFTPSNSLAATY